MEHDHRLVGIVPKSRFKPGCPHLRLLPRQIASNEGAQVLLPQQGKALFIGSCQPGDVSPLSDFFIQRFPHPGKNLGQFLGIHRLQNILHHIELNGLLGILKFVKAGENNQLHAGVGPHQVFAHGKAIHKRHFNICEHHIQRHRLRLLQGVLSVFRFQYHLEAQSLPVQLPNHGLPDLLLIIYNHNSIAPHGSASAFLDSFIIQIISRGCKPREIDENTVDMKHAAPP
ncbi:unknown [Firmicutes bacterium CAG:137]|nr:unknown [Firmicutes bacterium CAG:137]